VSELISYDRDSIDRSLVRILLRVENDLSTVAVPTGSRCDCCRKRGGGRGTFLHTGAKLPKFGACLGLKDRHLNARIWPGARGTARGSVEATCRQYSAWSGVVTLVLLRRHHVCSINISTE
jgi:hypothetical protein